ncbi:MAG TPA: hypothetical protein PLD23_11380 [Armatimonadota bacterium]|nr:hypothetical protein [Armatimonadota bacterium]
MQTGRLCEFALAALAIGASSEPQWPLDVETGLARNPHNRFGIPGTTGTMVSLPDEFSTADSAFGRYRFTYSPAPGVSWSLSVAPPAFDSHDTAPKDISFLGSASTGSASAAGTALDISYVFNSCWLTYRRTFRPRGRLTWGPGLTAKVRDAEVHPTSDTQTASRGDLGVVPLTNFHADRWIGEDLSVVLGGDALAAPQGRAEHVMLALK